PSADGVELPLKLPSQTGQTGQPGVAGGSPAPATVGTLHAIAFPTSLATACQAEGSHPSAAATSEVSWRRCTNAGRCFSPRLVASSAPGSTKHRYCASASPSTPLAMNSLPDTQNAVRQSASPNTWKIRLAIGMYTEASGRGGSITRQRWNIVDQS